MMENLRTIPTTYRVKDLVYGIFYHEKLKLVLVEQGKMYKMERVLKKSKRGGNAKYFVKWKVYGNKFNTWILKEDLIAQLSYLEYNRHG